MYFIIYGVDTETLMDPDETAILALPDKCADMESEELCSWIRENWGGDEINDQPVVGLDDVLESFQVALEQAGVDGSIITEARETVIDAVANNIYG